MRKLIERTHPRHLGMLLICKLSFSVLVYPCYQVWSDALPIVARNICLPFLGDHSSCKSSLWPRLTPAFNTSPSTHQWPLIVPVLDFPFWVYKPTICLSICLSFGPSFGLSIGLSISFSIGLSIGFSIGLSICLSICLSIGLSIGLPQHYPDYLV